MPNNPHLTYRPDVFMSTRVHFELDAADCAVLMSWFMKVDLDGITYIAYQLSEQIGAQIYTKDSLKAADTAFHQAQEQANPFHMMAQAAGMVPLIPDPDDFKEDEWPSE